MLLFLRRILIIAILLFLGYLIYGWVNPEGAQKIKDQIESINIPLQSAKQSAQELLIKEIETEDKKQEDSETQVDVMQQDEQQAGSGTQQGTLTREGQDAESQELKDLREYLDEQLNAEQSQSGRQDNNAEQQPTTQRNEASIDTSIQKRNTVEKQDGLSAEDYRKIEELLNSLLQE